MAMDHWNIRLMKKQDKEDLFSNEAKACVGLISQTWDVPIFRNKKGEVIDLEKVVGMVFTEARESARNHTESSVCQDDFYRIRDERRDHLKATATQEGHADFFCDGVHEAICHFKESLDVMYKSSFLSLTDRLRPVLNYMKGEISGFEQCVPFEYGKYLELYAADTDVAYDFSMEKLKANVSEFSGMSGEDLNADSFPELNSLYNITQNVRNGRKLDSTFISHVFMHAMAVQRHCNNLEISAELRQIDIKADFTNDMVVLNTPWATIAAASNPKPQRPPEKLFERQPDQSAVKAPMLSKEEQESQERGRKERARKLILSIYGQNQP
jgi:hypothetical protein